MMEAPTVKTGSASVQVTGGAATNENTQAKSASTTGDGAKSGRESHDQKKLEHAKKLAEIAGKHQHHQVFAEKAIAAAEKTVGKDGAESTALADRVEAVRSKVATQLAALREKDRDNQKKAAAEVVPSGRSPLSEGTVVQAKSTPGLASADHATNGSLPKRQYDQDIARELTKIQTEVPYQTLGYKQGMPFKVSVVPLSDRFLALTHPSHEKNIELPVPVAQDVLKWMQSARDSGHDIKIISSFRSNEEQAVLRNASLSGRITNPAAIPGYSRHQSATAIDIDARNPSDLAYAIRTCEAHGFRHTYGDSDPGHFDWVGLPEGSGRGSGSRQSTGEDNSPHVQMVSARTGIVESGFDQGGGSNAPSGARRSHDSRWHSGRHTSQIARPAVERSAAAEGESAGANPVQSAVLRGTTPYQAPQTAQLINQLHDLWWSSPPLQIGQFSGMFEGAEANQIASLLAQLVQTQGGSFQPGMNLVAVQGLGGEAAGTTLFSIIPGENGQLRVVATMASQPATVGAPAGALPGALPGTGANGFAEFQNLIQPIVAANGGVMPQLQVVGQQSLGQQV